MRRSRSRAAALAVIASALGCVGCATRHAIIASTGTNIGVDIAQNPTTQSPHAKLGYQRVEVAIVPTNRTAESQSTNGSYQGGALDHGDVIMELRYGGIFDTGPSSGIYQRLAVGTQAVRQPGASLMFARDADGGIDANAKAALESLASIPEPDADLSQLKVDVVRARQKADAPARKEIEDAVKEQFADWTTFLASDDADRVKRVVDRLKAKKLL